MKSISKSFREFLFLLTPRYLLGLTLILASFIAAFLISSSADRTITVWASTADFPPGKIIEASDITPARVQLIDNAEQYLDTKLEIIGTAVTRSIGAAELIPSFAISKNIDTSLQKVPIQVARDLAPVGVQGGDIVDLYGIPNQSALQSGLVSELILESVAIYKIDETGRDLGGALGVTLLVPESLVADLISTIGNFNFIIVQRNS